MRILSSTTRSRKVQVGLVLAATGAAMIGVASPAAAATPVPLTLSQTAGPAVGGNTITASTPSTTPTFSAGVDVEFEPAALTTTPCAAVWTTPTTGSTGNGYIDITAARITIISTNRIAITIPTITGAAAKYNVCAYAGNTPASTGVTGSPLIAGTVGTGITPSQTQYATGSVANPTSITPSGGPAQGGTTVIIGGTGFPTTTGAVLTATLGGAAMTISNVTATAITAVTPPHAAGAVNLIVTTAGGPATLRNAFTYSNGVAISPATGPSSRASNTPLDVQGVGFGALTFTTVTSPATGDPNDTNAHVYLVSGAYNPGSGATKANGEVVDCINGMVLSDTELLCNMNLGLGLTSNGASSAIPTRTASVTTDGTTGALTGVTGLTSADVGARVSGTGLADLSTITAVGSGTATVSPATTAAGSPTITVGAYTITATTTSASNALTAIGGAGLTAANAGDVITGPGIVPGTVIVSQTGAAAVLSMAAGSTNAGASYTLSRPVPVPDGTYTVTVVNNGAPGELTDPNFSQSIISSGATFTVAAY